MQNNAEAAAAAGLQPIAEQRVLVRHRTVVCLQYALSMDACLRRVFQAGLSTVRIRGYRSPMSL